MSVFLPWRAKLGAMIKMNNKFGDSIFFGGGDCRDEKDKQICHNEEHVWEKKGGH